jgi:hypothetical protein
MIGSFRRSIALIAFGLCFPCVFAADLSQGSSEAVVQAQLDAYNARDMDNFLSAYSDDAELYSFPATLLAKGKQALRERYEKRFVDATLHATLVNRIVMDKTVIDQESVHLLLPEGSGTLNAVAIYEVKDGKIVKSTLIYGPKVIDSPKQK